MEEIKLTVFDTSSWVEALRKKGRLDVRDRVELLLINGAAGIFRFFSMQTLCLFKFSNHYISLVHLYLINPHTR